MNVEMVDAAQKDWVDVRMEKFAALVRHVGWVILAPNLAAEGNLKFLRSVTRIPPLVRNSIVENIEHVKIINILSSIQLQIQLFIYQHRC